MGSSSSAPVVPIRKAVPANKARLCEAGFSISHWTGRARTLIDTIAKKYPEDYESWFYFDSHSNYYKFLKDTFDSVPFPPHLKGHQTSPFIWIERHEDKQMELIGGTTQLYEWVKGQPKLANDPDIKKLINGSPSFFEAFHNGSKAPQSTADITA